MTEADAIMSRMNASVIADRNKLHFPSRIEDSANILGSLKVAIKAHSTFLLEQNILVENLDYTNS
jgi:hypothetical protein